MPQHQFTASYYMRIKRININRQGESPAQYKQNMKRYYLELNGVFVKDSNSLKIITRHYENYRKKYKDGLIGVYDKQTGEYIF